MEDGIDVGNVSTRVVVALPDGTEHVFVRGGSEASRYLPSFLVRPDGCLEILCKEMDGTSAVVRTDAPAAWSYVGGGTIRVAPWGRGQESNPESG